MSVHCQIDTTQVKRTAFHSGRPLYRVECMAHGLIHPSTTSAEWHLQAHLDDPTYVWFDPTERVE